MGSASLIRSSFLGGEIGPKSYGRIDLPQYNHCHELLKNVIPLPQGAATRRPGFGFIGITFDGENLPAATYKFVFSETESYLVEISSDDDLEESYIRVLDADAPFTALEAVPLLANTSPIYIPSESLPFLQYAQSADVVWFTHPSTPPFMLIRYLDLGSIAFKIENVIWNTFIIAQNQAGNAFQAEAQPFRDANIEDIEFTPSGTTGAITVAAATSAASPVYMFHPDMVGAWFKITQTSLGQRYTGSFRVTAMSGVPDINGFYSVVAADVIDTIKNTTSDADWEESSWNDYRGYPRAVSLFEGRVYFGGNSSEPDRGWASESANVFKLDARSFSNGAGFPAQAADSPYSFTPNAGVVSEINWLSAGKTLLAGTRGREYVLSGPDQTLSMGPTNISMTPETAHGSRYSQAERVAYAVMFLQTSGKKLRELVFDFNSDSYQGTDIGLHAHHLLDKVIVKIAWQEQPNGILWCMSEDGELISVTRERQQGIVAWARHELGGTNAVLKDLVVIPTGAGLNRLFISVEREVDGATMRTLEYQPEQISGEDELTPGFASCLDSFVAAGQLSATDTWSGFDHLIGETVRVVGSVESDASEPNIEGDFVVNSSGEIVLNREVKFIMAGLPFNSKIKTLKQEGGSAIGTAQGDMKRTHKLILRLYNSFGLTYGSNDSNQKAINFWSDDRPELVQLFTGDKFLDFPNGWDRDGQVQLESSSPFPFTVNFIVQKMVVNES